MIFLRSNRLGALTFHGLTAHGSFQARGHRHRFNNEKEAPFYQTTSNIQLSAYASSELASDYSLSQPLQKHLLVSESLFVSGQLTTKPMLPPSTAFLAQLLIWKRTLHFQQNLTPAQEQAKHVKGLSKARLISKFRQA